MDDGLVRSRVLAPEDDPAFHAVTDPWLQLTVAKWEARRRNRTWAEMTLRVLAIRGLVVPDDGRDRVLACSDAAQLAEWADRAFHVTDAAELFTPPSS